MGTTKQILWGATLGLCLTITSCVMDGGTLPPAAGSVDEITANPDGTPRIAPMPTPDERAHNIPNDSECLHQEGASSADCGSERVQSDEETASSSKDPRDLAAGPSPDPGRVDAASELDERASGWEILEQDGSLLHDLWISDGGEVFMVSEEGWVRQADRCKPVGASTGALYGIDGRNNSHVVAVGAGGVILETTMDVDLYALFTELESTPTEKDLFDVWFSASTQSYRGVTIGADGTILVSHAPGEWWPMYAMASNGVDLEEDLYAVWGAGPGDIWAVGANGTVMQFNGKHWAQIDLPTESHLVGITGHSASDVYVLGEDGTTARFDGSQWTVIAGGLNTPINGLVTPTSDVDPFVVGDEGLVFSLTGKSQEWPLLETNLTHQLTAGAIGPDNALYVVGEEGILLRRFL